MIFEQKEIQLQLYKRGFHLITDIVLNEFNVPWLRLTLGKPGAVPAASTVGLVIERGEKHSGGHC